MTAPSTSWPDGADIAASLAQALRDQGVAVPLASALLFTQALGAVGLADAVRVYTAGRVTLTHSPEQASAYDRAFASVFGGPQDQPAPPRPDPPVLRVTLQHDDPDAEDRDGAWELGEPSEDLTLRFSAAEILRRADLATLTAEEMAQAHALIAALRVVGPFRRGRRQRTSRRRTRGIDLRTTVARSLATQGEVVTLARRAPAPTPRRIVLLADISGSMEVYSRALLRFAHVVATARRRVEVFAIGTRLTRLTRSLASHDPDTALDQAAAEVADWGGGTRLGDALAEFNTTWALRGMARGAVVVILSDGWDRGDPADIAEQMQRLHRVAHRIIWVNPLVAGPGYAPTASGMAAALPFVDDLRAGHSIASLEALVTVLLDP